MRMAMSNEATRFHPRRSGLLIAARALLSRPRILRGWHLGVALVVAPVVLLPQPAWAPPPGSSVNNFVIRSVTGPLVATYGGGLPGVTVTVENVGGLFSSGGPTRVRFYWSLDPVIDRNDVPSSSTCVTDVDIFQHGGRCTTTVSVPFLLSPGQYFLGAVVDDLGTAHEQNEDDNTGVMAEPVTLTADQAYAEGVQSTFFVTSGSSAASFDWGIIGDRPVPGDYDGDGKVDFAIWRPREGSGEGIWYIVRSSDGAGVRRQWGVAGDIPVPGDYDGDGRWDIAVWRPGQLGSPAGEQGLWYIIRSSDGGGVQAQFGAVGDIPVPADYDGDGRTDIAVWRPSARIAGTDGILGVTIQATWFALRSSDGAQITQDLGSGALFDVPVPGDYDGDRRTDFAVWRPAKGAWLIIDSLTGGERVVAWGTPGDVPVPADYDGDGRTDIAVWRPTTGEWFVMRSSDGGVTARQWGMAGDVPIPGDYGGDRRADEAVFRP